MAEPNVLSFFLIILGGFGTVWGYRHFSKSNRRITDFEYLAFSAIWGSLVFAIFAWLMRNHSDQLIVLNTYPFVATPTVFVLGLFFGWTANWVQDLWNDVLN